MGMFFRRGKSCAFFVPTLASTSAPSAATINGGTDLSKAITAINNLTTDTAKINTPVLAYKQPIQSNGEQTFGDANIDMIEGDGVAGGDETAYAAAYTALTEDATGYLVLNPRKTSIASADKVEVWPVVIGANNRQWSLDNEAAKYQVAIAVTGPPVKNATAAA